jgi:GntR family transcriptional regulator, galactonate operon transcriptional repressor
MEILSQLENDQAHGGKIHDSVVRTLGGWILGGVYQPGDILPREDELAAQLGVSRTSVREAVKVVSANGLVESRQRIGVRVRPRPDWRLLDPAVLSWHPDLRRDPTLVADLLEVRRIIEPAAAELAARRATASDLALIETAYLSMARSIPEDPQGCCEADLAFHRSVIVASHNIVLAGLIGTIEAALRASFVLTSQLMQNQSKTLSVHKDVLEKIRLRDTAGARTAMNRLLDVAAEDLDLQG